ncbi:MAG TPA: response regulator [Polyangiaceae bacterium]|nr:response regulator [Polyangiaceae bacterium]
MSNARGSASLDFPRLSSTNELSMVVASPIDMDAGVAPLSGEAVGILVVDDNPANLIAIQAALGTFAGRVVRAQSGKEALGQLLIQDFAVILLDVKMPSMDGLETARMIRARKRSRHTPIIFITAHGRDDREVLQGYELGAVDFLFKPLVAEVLQAKVSVFIELDRRAAEMKRQAELLREHERREHERTLESERRRWEAESLRRQMDELEAADRHKDEFLALLGHELRNPLAPIVTGLELLRKKLAAAERTDAALVRTCVVMQRQARHLTRLVDDLLDVSRISTGKVELRRSVVALQDIIEQAVATSRPLIDSRGHVLEVRLPEERLRFRCDGVRLVQAVANLLNNAARYTDPGGRITIDCRADGPTVEIAVADTGRGIAPEFLPRIFEKFVQERDAAGGGLGLGLTVAAELVKLHAGTIEAFSDGAGRGSRFVIRIPVDEWLSEPTPLPATPPEDTEGRPLVVALVDDNSDIRDLLQELLGAWGHRVEAAPTGGAGIELIVRLKPDVALVDIGLPDMDGYDVATSVRKTLGDGAVRLVAMTGFGRDTDKRLAREAGFDVHLVKPVDVDSLKRVLRT